MIDNISRYSYPFLYMALYLIWRHTPNHNPGLGWAIGTWYVSHADAYRHSFLLLNASVLRFYEVIIYEVLLAVVVGSVIG
jgi:hypothetical protein